MEALAVQLMNVASDMAGAGELISTATVPGTSVESGAGLFGRLLKGCTSTEEVAAGGDMPLSVDTRHAITDQHDETLVMQQEVVAGMMAALHQVLPMAEAGPESQVSSEPERAEAHEQVPVQSVQQNQPPVPGTLPQAESGGTVPSAPVVSGTTDEDMRRQAVAYDPTPPMVVESVSPKGMVSSTNDVEQFLKQRFQAVTDQEPVGTQQQAVTPGESRAVGSMNVQKPVVSEPPTLSVTPGNGGPERGVEEAVVRQTPDRGSITMTFGESPEVVFSQEPVLLEKQDVYSKPGMDEIVFRTGANREPVAPETSTASAVSGNQQVFVGDKNDTLMAESIPAVSSTPVSSEAPVQMETHRNTTGLSEGQRQQAVAIEVQEGMSVDEMALRAETQQEEKVIPDLPGFVRHGVPTALTADQQHQNRRVVASPSDVSSVVEQAVVSPAAEEVVAASSPSFEGGGTDNQSLQKPLSEAVRVPEAPTNGMASQVGEPPRFSTTVSHHESQSTLEELPGKIMQEVHQRFSDQRTLASGQDQITIRLTPEHLGEVKLTIAMEGQQLSVEIMSDNPQARETIMQYADSLKESLSRQNINLDSFEVTSQDRGSGGFSRGRDEWRQFSANQNNLWISRAGYAVPEAVTGQLPPAYGGITNNSMIDLHF